MVQTPKLTLKDPDLSQNSASVEIGKLGQGAINNIVAHTTDATKLVNADREISPEFCRAFISACSEIINGRAYEREEISLEDINQVLESLFEAELDGHLELLAHKQDKKLTPLPLTPTSSPEEQLKYLEILVTNIHQVQNGNNACITPRLSRELNGMDCSMSTWTLRHRLKDTPMKFEWGLPVEHSVGIVTLSNGDQYYADGQGGFVEQIETVETQLPLGARIIEIKNWPDIQARRTHFFPRYVFTFSNAHVVSAIGNMDSMLYKQYLGPLDEAAREKRGEDALIVEKLQPYARKFQESLGADSQNNHGVENSPLNTILEQLFPESEEIYECREYGEEIARFYS